MANAVSLSEQLSGSTFTMPEQTWSVVRAADPNLLCQLSQGDAPIRSCLAAIHDHDAGELTLIVQTETLASFPLAKDFPVHGEYRLIRFNLLAPFEGVGFIAAITAAVAREGVNLLALSGYSHDYLLVKTEDAAPARAGLLSLGIRESP